MSIKLNIPNRFARASKHVFGQDDLFDFYSCVCFFSIFTEELIA